MKHGNVAIVTGGGSGIGAALSKAMAQRGVHVVLADRDVDAAESVAQRIVETGGQATVMELDVRHLASFKDVAATTLQKLGRIDYLFNNAGVAVSGQMSDYTEDDWEYVIDVNLKGVAWGIQTVYPIMREQGFGHIISTASTAGLLPAPLGSYTATKHAVVGLSKSLRIEGKSHGVKSSVLCPGAINTPILMGGKFGRKRGKQPTDDQIREMWRRMRPMDPDDFAEQALEGVRRNLPVIIVPRWWRSLWYLERISSRLSIRLWQRFADSNQAMFDRD